MRARPFHADRDATARDSAQPLPIGAGVTGFDSTNARRKKSTKLKSPARAPPLSAAQTATARAISREAQQRYRRDVVPLGPDATGVPAAAGHRSGSSPPRRSMQDPFAPLGVRSGSFLLFPAVELIGGYDSNPLRLRTGEPERRDIHRRRRNCWCGPTGSAMR